MTDILDKLSGSLSQPEADYLRELILDDKNDSVAQFLEEKGYTGQFLQDAMAELFALIRGSDVDLLEIPIHKWSVFLNQVALTGEWFVIRRGTMVEHASAMIIDGDLRIICDSSTPYYKIEQIDQLWLIQKKT